MKIITNKRQVRHRRIRAKLSGTKTRPRLSVFRSNVHIFAQLIDDASGKTIFSASDIGHKKSKMTRVEVSKEVGKELAKKATEKGIAEVLFDRGGYRYHGRVKALADGAREGGLKF